MSPFETTVVILLTILVLATPFGRRIFKFLWMTAIGFTAFLVVMFFLSGLFTWLERAAGS